jgi:hypothetical protein
MSIESALREHERELLSLPHVTGVGIGHLEGKEVILVLVKPDAHESGPAVSSIPKTIGGFEVVVQPELQIGG